RLRGGRAGQERLRHPDRQRRRLRRRAGVPEAAQEGRAAAHQEEEQQHSRIQGRPLPVTSVANRIQALLAALVLVLPAVALADARSEAKRHFQKGMTLISRGSLDEGIGELREAYAIKPHPNVLYNIARAYLDAGRLKESVELYKRYMASGPADLAQVRATVARLEETLKAKEAAEAPPP